MTMSLIERARKRRNLPGPEERRFLRERAGLSQREVAEEIGVTRTAVCLWEAGKRTPRGENLDRYCDLLAALREEMFS